MKKTIVKLTVVTTLGMGSLIIQPPFSTAYAASSLNELNRQKSDIERKQNSVESELNNTNDKINEIQNEQAVVKSEIERLNTAISSNQVKIIEKKEQIDTTKEEIKKLEEQIKEVQARIEKRNELLKERARAYQETGGVVSYIDVLMGSQSFSDFIDRVGAVATIVEADQGILREQEADKKLLEESQAQLKEKLDSLEDMLNDLESMKLKLNSQKKEKDSLMAKLEKEEDHAHAEMLTLEEQESILADQKGAMEKAIKLEKTRLAEEERKRKEAAAKAAAEAKAKANASSNGSNDSSPAVVSAPAVSSGSFTRPASGYISSGLGQRWGTFHAGVDIASGGTVPIVAAADGVVIRSAYSSSYGEVIYISHYIDGQVYTTVYAHMRMGSRQVSGGQVVQKGQTIGTMGNTGDSQGQHLHFELHRGPWNAAKSNAINPIGIIPF